MSNELSTIHIGENPSIAVDYQGTGDLILLLHGFAGSRKDWRLNIGALAENFQVAAVDLRGFGDSSSYEGPYRYADSANDLIQVIEHFGKTKAHIIGVQAGARLAVDFAISEPDYVDRLIAASTNSGAGSMREQDKELVRTKFMEPFARGKTLLEVMSDPHVLALSQNANPQAKDILLESIAKVEMDNLIKLVEVQMTWDRKDTLSQITAPTLLLRGDDDHMIGPEVMTEINQAIAGSVIQGIENAAHNIHVEQPDSFNQIVLSFLRA